MSESGCEMGDGPDKIREAHCMLKCVLWGSTHALGYKTKGRDLSGLVNFGPSGWTSSTDCVDKLSKDLHCIPSGGDGIDR